MTAPLEDAGSNRPGKPHSYDAFLSRMNLGVKNAPEKSSLSSDPMEQQSSHSFTLNHNAYVANAPVENTPATVLHEEPLEDLTDHTFQNMRLRRIIKENHGCDMNQVAFFKDPISSAHASSNLPRNLLATVGGAQANVYDNEHCGDHLDIISHFALDGFDYEAPEPGKIIPRSPYDLLTCCWIHASDDAVFAVGGTDTFIHLLSVACSQELQVLKGHEDDIIDLKAHPLDPQLLLSASTDGTVRLWHLDSGTCICIFNVDATCLCFHDTGQTFLTGTAAGVIQEWAIPEACLFLNSSKMQDFVLEIVDEGVILTDSLHKTSRIECVQYMNEQILSKSLSGKILLWDPNTSRVYQQFTLSGPPNHCRFDVTYDGRYCCVGSYTGVVSVLNLETGEIVAELRHKRSTKSIRCCAFSHDGRNIVYVSEDSFIWRLDALK